MKRLKILHTSDTHLGADWRPELEERALQAIVNGAVTLDANVVVIVGDVFDHARVSDSVLEYFVEQISSINIPVVVLPGNHDLYDSNSLYKRHAFNNRPINLHIMTNNDGETITFPHLDLDVWGRAMLSHTPQFQPIKGMPHKNKNRWLVGLAHGHFHFENDTEVRSSPIYPLELANATCDYLALGHWERYVDVSQGDVKAVYSGSPLGALQSNDMVSVILAELDPDNGVVANRCQLPMVD
jgi:DNA repair exonuclease SbcCD nuclease subunit